jgi:hypothetical protein
VGAFLRQEFQLAIGLALSLSHPVSAQDPTGPVPGFCEVRNASTGDEDGATLYGRADLEHEASESDSRELRLTVGGGIGLQSWTVRVLSGAAGVTGEVFNFWPAKGSHRVLRGHPKCQEHFDAQDTWLAGLAAKSAHEVLGCDRILTAGVFEVCKVGVASNLSWSGLLAQIDSLDIWALPDPSTLPLPKTVALDAPGLTVTMRDRTTFRRFSYWPTGSDSGPEYARAARMQQIVLELLRRTIGNVE